MGAQESEQKPAKQVGERDAQLIKVNLRGYDDSMELEFTFECHGIQTAIELKIPATEETLRSLFRITNIWNFEELINTKDLYLSIRFEDIGSTDRKIVAIGHLIEDHWLEVPQEEPS